MDRFFKLFSLLFLGILLSFTTFNDKKIIVIDAGHGGTDLGVSKNGISEKDIVLDIAKRIKALNKNENIEIVLTRESDAATTLPGRTDLINKLEPSMVISLHVNNSKNTESSGNIIYTKPETFDFAKNLASKFGDCKIEEANLHLLRNSKSPAMLLELGYMSNERDRTYLTSDTGKDEISRKVIAFINEH